MSEFENLSYDELMKIAESNPSVQMARSIGVCRYSKKKIVRAETQGEIQQLELDLKFQ